MSERAKMSKCDAAFLKVGRFITHPASISVTTVINGLGAYAALKGHADNSTEAFGIFEAECSVAGLGLLAYEGSKSVAEKLRKADRAQLHSQQPNFTDYVDEEGGPEVHS